VSKPYPVVVAVAASLFCGTVCAEGPEPTRPPAITERQTALHGALTVVGAALWITLEMRKDSIAASSCRWCDRDLTGGDKLNGVDRSLRTAVVWSNPAKADQLSDLVAFGGAVGLGFGLPALAAWHDGRSENIPYDSLVIAESVVIAMNLNQLSKLMILRERPFVHYAEDREEMTRSGDDNLSFFSGHATLAWSLAVSSGTVASMRGYRLSKLVWASGLTLAVGTSYLRMAADKHYFTDQLVGAGVGSLVGFAVPYFFHGKTRLRVKEFQIRPRFGMGGGMLAVKGKW
jgi:membrane-associated phospholipid phosphatase